jgi:site-specific DNA recombinase
MAQSNVHPPGGPLAEAKFAAIYARVSTEDQANGYSLPSQVEACQKLAAQQGYTVPESYIFREDYTGTVLDRPRLRALRELVRTRAIQAVAVYDPDRLARRFALQVILEEELDQAGVRMLCVNHNREETPEGRAMGYIKGVFAEVEREKLRERTQRGRVYRARAGQVWGGMVPFGYRAVREPHKACWAIEEAEAAVVRRIFAWCLKGHSTYGIAQQLSAERVSTRGNGRRVLAPGIWRASSVYNILTNEAYVGRAYAEKYENIGATRRRLRPREQWIAIPVPPILDEAPFAAVQAQLQRNKERSPRNRKHDYLLSGGHMRCGRCGRAMTGAFYRQTRVYRCGSKWYVLDPAARCAGQVKADVVEREVWEAVVRVLEDPARIAAEVAKQEARAEDQRAEIARQIAAIEAQLAKCEREAQRWADAYAAEVISLEELKGYRAEIEARRQGLLTERASLQARLDAIGRAVHQVDALTAYCARVRQRLERFDYAEQRLALAALYIQAIWTPGQPLVIEGSVPLVADASMSSSCHRCLHGPWPSGLCACW